MKFIISGYFDAGFSIGIDDYPFVNPEVIAMLNQQYDFSVKYNKPADQYAFADELNKAEYTCDDAEGHIGLSVPIGAGLEIDLQGSAMLKQLHAEAMQAVADPRFMGSYYSNPPAGIADIISDFQAEAGFRKAVVHLYGLGIGYLYIESDELSEHLADYALWIYRCYEYATYGTYSSGDFRNGFRKSVSSIFRSFGKRDGIEQITRRRIPCDFFPGYQVVLMCTKQGDVACAEKILNGYDELTPIRLDDGNIQLGWAAAIVEPVNEDYVTRIQFLLKMTQVYYGICDGFERLFSHHISQSVRENLSGDASLYDAVSLNRLRTIAHTVAEYTRFGALTQNISDLKLLNAFDQLGGLSAKIEHMASACEIFTNIQNEVIEQKQASRDKRLNVYAMALTALTIVSVLADMMSINEAIQGDKWTLLIKLAAILGLLVLVIYMTFEGRFRKLKLHRR
ncbi:hypothetical protein [Lentimicrobium sp.]|jgi:hypothetical protein|uniref:hypothetical protein n=1 Tax=Lentimicrobium sp. TaxID=2034841 RepID=UPI002CD6E3CB|nr:hypothetical protein [Lentimicrobium sp.]HOP13582.1 hypothetical protein [Lentimicrobium sp.]HPF64925.1 hypothetical protein [Lentimicrobium sp.]HPJ61545.1 hypothetical protein [Lentimicrobium sp.]HPR26241.1 hypothetical protein [Lentimicrobium sp.]